MFVDDIIFGGNDDMSNDFANEIKSDFEMSLVGEIKNFIGLQIQKIKSGIFIICERGIKDIWYE